MKRTLLYILVLTGIITFDWLIDRLLYPKNQWYDALLAVYRSDFLILIFAGMVWSVWADWTAWRKHSRSDDIGGV